MASGRPRRVETEIDGRALERRPRHCRQRESQSLGVTGVMARAGWVDERLTALQGDAVPDTPTGRVQHRAHDDRVADDFGLGDRWEPHVEHAETNNAKIVCGDDRSIRPITSTNQPPVAPGTANMNSSPSVVTVWRNGATNTSRPYWPLHVRMPLTYGSATGAAHQCCRHTGALGIGPYERAITTPRRKRRRPDVCRVHCLDSGSKVPGFGDPCSPGRTSA